MVTVTLHEIEHTFRRPVLDVPHMQAELGWIEVFSKICVLSGGVKRYFWRSHYFYKTSFNHMLAVADEFAYEGFNRVSRGLFAMGDDGVPRGDR